MALTMVRSHPGDAGADATQQSRGGGLQCAMIDEIFANATEEQALSFFVAVGARLALAYPLPANDGLLELELAINAAWRDSGLGRVVLTMEPDGIAIDHIGYSATEAAQSPSWPQAAEALLRGAYGAWFASLGGAPALTTTLVGQTSERIHMRYGL